VDRVERRVWESNEDQKKTLADYHRSLKSGSDSYSDDWALLMELKAYRGETLSALESTCVGSIAIVYEKLDLGSDEMRRLRGAISTRAHTRTGFFLVCCLLFALTSVSAEI
jgi:hypothetical protein